MNPSGHRSIILFFFAVLIMFSAFSSCKKNHPEIPTLNILIDDEISWTKKKKCTVVYSFDGDTVNLPATLRIRGGISSKYDKHSYRLELDKAYPLCKLPTDDDWIINSNYIDKTFMRHKISYDLFRQMSSNNIAPLCGYINLEVNGEYRGLYVLMEKVNASMLGLNKKDTMAMLFKDPPVFYSEKLEYVKDSTNYYHQKFPKKHKRDKTYYIEAFIDFIFNSTDVEFATKIGEWVDIDNIVDWHILLLFTNNGDGIMKNYYVYKKDTHTPLRWSPWDYDHSFGRDGDNELNMLVNKVENESSVMLRRLMDIPECDFYRQQIKTRWKELRNLNIISFDNIKSMVDENDKIIRSHVGKNFEKWPVGEKWYFDSNTYEQELEIILEFVKIQIPQLDEYFENL